MREEWACRPSRAATSSSSPVNSTRDLRIPSVTRFASPTRFRLTRKRSKAWNRSEQDWRDQPARRWRRACRVLDAYDPATRSALLAYWNGHRWRPGDPVYLLDSGSCTASAPARLVLERGHVRAAVAVIPVQAATAAFGPAKPVSRGWLGTPARLRIGARHPL